MQRESEMRVSIDDEVKILENEEKVPVLDLNTNLNQSMFHTERLGQSRIRQSMEARERKRTSRQ